MYRRSVKPCDDRERADSRHTGVSVSSSPSAIVALLVPGVVGLVAFRLGSLSRGGAVAASVIGALALFVSWGWGAYLIAWFALAAAISRWGRTKKSQRTRGIVAKGDQRDAWQVLANGGVFALCALLTLVAQRMAGSAGDALRLLAVAAAGALAAAGADTWATEIGTLFGGAPWSLRLRAVVPVGTSGAVSLVGTLAAVAAGVLLAAIAAVAHMYPPMLMGAVALAAFVGAFADSVLGAWWQERRHCPRCHSDTEQRRHECGTDTRRTGGVGPLDNDAVNLCCTIVGAIVALCLSLGGARI